MDMRHMQDSVERRGMVGVMERERNNVYNKKERRGKVGEL